MSWNAGLALPEWILASAAILALVTDARTSADRKQGVVRWTRLLFTYLLPAIPMICLWDGVVSQLRAYSAEELEALGRSAAPEYAWRSGTLRHVKAPLKVTFLVGIPPGREER